jgi:hypothetical protein
VFIKELKKKKMGGNFSTNMSKMMAVVENSTKASCKPRQAVDQEIDGLRVSFKNSACRNIDIGNRSTLVADCDMSSVAQALAQQTMELTKQQAAGLTLPGTFNISMDMQERTNVIKQHLEQECATEQAVKQKLKNAVFEFEGSECDTLKIVNQANLTSQCISKVVQDALSKQKDTVSLSQTNEVSPWAILAIMLPILLIVGVVFFVRSRQQQKPPMKRPPMKAGAKGVAGVTSGLPSVEELGKYGQAARKLLKK